jgi:DNA-directed RNA polymerase subunit L/DNA-directed RNA polymerase alpha subunit
MEPVFKNYQSSRSVRPNTIQFQLAPTHVSYANTLRRLCMSGVETVGFRADIQDNGSTTDVEILANSTPMTNEMLAHRVGLLSIHVQDPLKWIADDVSFVLDKTNTSDRAMDVTASDFLIVKKGGDGMDMQPSSAAQFFPPNPITGDTALLAVLKPLVPGGKPEEIRIKAKATIGTGRDNARFIPTCQCAYSYTRDSSPEAVKKVFDDWVDRSKKLNPASLETEPEKKAVLMREFNTLEINRCYLKNEQGEPYSFDFTVESVGVLSPEYIVLRACEAGAKLCERFANDALPEDVIVQAADCRLRAIDFFFQKQDHTLGHLIQAWLDEHMVGQGDITFAGYDIPHPLRDEMVIRIGVAGDNPEATARSALKQAMTACQAMFAAWRDQWSAIVIPVGPAAAASAAPVTQARRAVRRPVTVLPPVKVEKV